MSVVNLTLDRYPTADLLKLLANILTHIAQSNDHNPPVSIASTGVPSPSTHSLTSAAKTVLRPSTPSPTSPSSTNPTTSSYSTSTIMPLTFHARNVPTISLESYFLRILKYCPTSNFVFLSLLVYFDRMAALSLASGGASSHPHPSCNGLPGRRIFRVDSYNVHRLVIAGVAVASKFFSDVFYTNSRYAKVGGLPLPELNQLELQFLLLNDFRLVISPQQMHLYTQHLIRFSLEHPPPSMALDLSVLSASLGVATGLGFGLNPLGFQDPQPRYQPPAPLRLLNPRSPVKNKHKRTTPTTPTTAHTSAHPDPKPSSSSSSPLIAPSSPPLRPFCSPSPSNSSSSSLSSSPSSSPRPPRMTMNGHLVHTHSLPNISHSHFSSHSHTHQTTGKARHSKLPSPLNEEETETNGSNHSDEDDSDSDDEADADEETETIASTDDESEPTIRAPRTVVGWEGEGRNSP